MMEEIQVRSRWPQLLQLHKDAMFLKTRGLIQLWIAASVDGSALETGNSLWKGDAAHQMAFAIWME